MYLQNFVSRGFTVLLSYMMSRGLSATVVFASAENVTIRVKLIQLILDLVYLRQKFHSLESLLI